MQHLKIKMKIKNLLPNFLFNFLIFIWRNTYIKINTKIRENSYKRLSVENVFTKIYKENRWGSDESSSGPGSEYDLTKHIRKGIFKLIKDFNIKIFIDAPCGDINWIEPEKMGIKYIGCDIVKELIKSNKNKTNSKNVFLKQLDITKDKLPKGDLIHCRECLQHLSEENIKKFLKNIKNSKIKYLLTTTHNSKYNKNIVNGEYFPINLEIRPYNFPKPLLSIEEVDRNKITGEKKYLALWSINKI